MGKHVGFLGPKLAAKADRGLRVLPYDPKVTAHRGNGGHVEDLWLVGIWHGLQNVGGTEALMLNFPTRAYDYEDPDHWRLPYDSEQIPYTWGAHPTARLRNDHKQIK